jgi:hypothetical protein
LKYTPSYDGSASQDTNYSGEDTVEYTYTDPNGVVTTTIVTVTVNPVADLPTDEANKTINTYEDNSYGPNTDNYQFAT